MLSKRLKRWLLILAVACVLTIASLVIAVIYLSPEVWLMQRGVVALTRWDTKKGQLVTVNVGPKSENWTNIQKVSRYLAATIILAEDLRFYEHYGLDFTEIWHSYLINREKGRYVRGASTITQQVVRMVFLSREKTVQRKLREAAGALVLECLLDKDEILEWYVNLIPFGHGIYGIKEASEYFFNNEPELLTIDQSLLLALIIPGPSIWVQGLDRKNLSEMGQKRYAKLASSLFQQGYISYEQLKKVMATGNFGSPIIAN